MAQSNNYKSSSVLIDDLDYERWKKEIKSWRMFTSLEKKNRHLHLLNFNSASSRNNITA